MAAWRQRFSAEGLARLFAALDVLTGKLIGSCLPRRRHTGFLKLLETIHAEVPAALDIHLILDNNATREHPTVEARLEKRPRFHPHSTPTSASWLNLVER